jgi:1-acyl-sn-glycerol-3-phosphate acyltransferase
VDIRERGVIDSCARLDEPWSRSAGGRAARAAILGGFFEPVLDWYTARDVSGVERLSELRAPAVFVANHSSHIDTPLILRALPASWRGRTVVGAAADYFYARRHKAALVSLLFGTVPIARKRGGRSDLDHVDRLLAAGWSLLMYPEGTRTGDEGEHRLRTGAALLAARHGLPLVPIHLTGTRAAMPLGQVWPRRKAWQPRHPVRIAFGAPIWPTAPREREAAIGQVEEFFAAQSA